MSSWPLTVHALAGSACGVALWRQAGQLRATVVVKGTFRMAPNGPMEPAEPVAVLRADEHHGGSPAKSLQRSRELAPYRPRCDVTLHGKAHAPASQPVPASSARLAVFRAEQALVDRTVHVFGARSVGPDGVPSSPEPFISMPLDYERALRGDANPNGVNPAKGAPNLVDPEQPDTVAGGFGPVSRYAKQRRQLLGSADRKALEATIAEIPDPFDGRYFQSAPPPQQCDPLVGNEWVILDGMNVAQSRLASQLPEVHAEACVVGLSPEGAATVGADRAFHFVPVPLRADGLHIDAEAATVTVTWRGSFPLASDEHLGELVVTGGHALGGEPLEWPEPDELSAAAQTVVLQAEPQAAPAFDGTHSVQLGGGTDSVGTLPFAGTMSAVEVSIKPTPQVIGEGTITFGDASGSTLTLTADQRDQVTATLGTSAWTGGETEPSAGQQSTQAVSPSELARALKQAKAPFNLAQPGEGPAVAAPPGAPFAAAEDSERTQAVSPATLAEARRATAPYELARADGEAKVVAPAGAPYAAERAAPVSAPVGDQTLDVLGGAHDGSSAASTEGAGVDEEVVAASRFFHQLPRRQPESEDGEEAVETEPVLPPRTTEGIPVVNTTAMHVVTAPWQHRPPHDSLTFIVKASFELQPGQAATLAEESDLPQGDVHVDDDLDRALLYPSDFAHFKPRADVVVLGRAHAPRDAAGQRRGAATEVRLQFGRDAQRIDRHVAVFGNRQWTKAVVTLGQTAPEPFESLPMDYERAFGGPGFAPNPVGMGYLGAASADGVAWLPNLEDPGHLITAPGDKPQPACLGPISPQWRQRRGCLGRYDDRWLRTRWPYFPDDFDWGYYQCAPRSQQLEHLSGDEPFCLSGMHAEQTHFEGTLPGMTPRLFMAMKGAIAGAPGATLAFEQVVLALDTVVFDMDATQMHLVWRGLVEVSDEHAPEIQALYLLVDPPGQETDATEAYARFLAQAQHKEPVEEPPEGEPEPANDTEPEPAAEEADDEPAVAAQVEAQQQELRDRLAELGIPTDSSGEVPKPPPPEPAAVVETLRAAGMPDEEAAEILDAMAAAQASPEEDTEPAEPELSLRDQALAVMAEGEPLDERDLAGIDLSELDLSGRSFRGCDLSGADLHGCHLIEAQLQGAVLDQANLRGARLDRAQLQGADLSAAQLEQAVLDGADLTDVSGHQAQADGASFRAVTGRGPDFSESSLVGAHFDGARLERPSLAEATFDEAVFDGAELPFAHLFDASGKGASFRAANLENALCDGVDLTGANLSQVRAAGSVWEGAILDDTVWLEARLDQASFVRASLQRSDLSACELREVRMKRARACYARFVKSNLHEAQLERSDLEGADFTGANLYACETWKANLKKTRFDQAIVAMSKLEGKA